MSKSEQVLAILKLWSMKVTVEVLTSTYIQAYDIFFLCLSSDFKISLNWISLGKRCTLKFAVVTSIPCYMTVVSAASFLKAFEFEPFSLPGKQRTTVS